MSDIKKIGYSTSELFTLTGNNYVGFYNIKDNIAYAGKYTQQIRLDNVDNIQNTVTVSDFFFNRIPNQDFTLTYTLSDFVFQPGEFVNSNSFDVKIQKAYINYLDTYRACFMASSDLPYNLTSVGMVSATNRGLQLRWVPSNTNTTSITPLSTFNSQIKPTSKIAYIYSEYSPYNTLVLANSSSLMVYKVQNYSTFALTFSTYYIETNTADYGSLTFGKITDISHTNNNLYVCDSGNATVYAYDMTSVLDNDRALGYKFNLTNSVNSKQGRFINPYLVSSSENTVFIYDNFLNIVYFYDTNFNLKDTYKNANLFADDPVVSLSYYKLYDQLFVLTAGFKLIILDKNANATIIQLSTDGISGNEIAKKIIFSNNNSDVIYLLSNKNLYKKFYSNIINDIGSYSFVTGITGSNATTKGSVLYDIDILNSNNNVDDIMLYGFNQFINYNELTVYNSLLK